MAVRVKDFARAHPSPDASVTPTVAGLEQLLTRAEALAIQERAGRLEEHSATLRRRQLRHTMHAELLRHLEQVAERVARQRPDLAGKFQAPDPKGPFRSFVTGAKLLLTQATVLQDLLVSNGLGETLVEELGSLIAQFEQATQDAHGGRRDHVGACADLGVVTDELMEAVRVLDGLYIRLFREDPEVLAAWASASNVVGPFRPKGMEPPSGGVSPAA